MSTINRDEKERRKQITPESRIESRPRRSHYLSKKRDLKEEILFLAELACASILKQFCQKGFGKSNLHKSNENKLHTIELMVTNS